MSVAQQTRQRILVVEDDAGLRELLAEELAERGYAVAKASNAEAALIAHEKLPADLVLCDLRLPGMPGTDLLERMRALPASPSFILMTAFGTVPQAVDALKEGADDFLTKPVDLEHLVLRISRTLAVRGLHREIERMRRTENATQGFHGMLGNSGVMRRLYEQIRRIAPASGAVLVTGESGTGKELVARAVHAESEYAGGPFVAVNCAGVPEQLLESEFFGHAAGAFTGASRARRGLFSAAHGGTLFLDEISEMPLALQAKLLRVLQEGKLRAVGADREQVVDVRIIAATNRDPAAMVGEGLLREDLYYRLEAFTLQVPPLRGRGDDLDLLTGYFVAQYARQQHKPRMHIAESALARLRAYSFPGNVRELQNAIERAVTFAAGDTIRANHLPQRLRENGARSPTADGLLAHGTDLPTLAELEQRYIRTVLERLGGNKRRAAEVLGIGRRTLYRKLGIE